MNLTTNQVAELLRIHKTSVTRLAKAGILTDVNPKRGTTSGPERHHLQFEAAAIQAMAVDPPDAVRHAQRIRHARMTNKLNGGRPKKAPSTVGTSAARFIDTLDRIEAKLDKILGLF